MKKSNDIKLLIAAGGTGGHLYPALAVFDKMKILFNHNISAIFVGNQNRLEGKVVPSMGFEFVHIPITGFKKLLSFQSLLLPNKILFSSLKCAKIIKSFNIDAVLCTGSYISYPAGLAAYRKKIPLILMESNVIPGKTIKMLAPNASSIITNFDETEKYFNKKDRSKVKVLGNPVRENLFHLPSKNEALKNFGLKEEKKTLLVFGGSLGANSINKVIENNIDKITEKNIQVIWQTGSEYLTQNSPKECVIILKYIEDMASAYSAADLVVCRAGATTISELTAIGKPSILIPYPKAANDHQKLNALALQSKGAAELLYDSEIDTTLSGKIIELINDTRKLNNISVCAKNLGRSNASGDIANYIINYIVNQKL
jgi:UDP-N-acetylglucosamine--N-acetylmuramyl-(pentapeptide) pyrophosphoryl-undecaprenol N-acetylglucosamine transferase